MAHLEIKPAVDFKPYGRLTFEETLSVKRLEKDSSGFDVLSKFKDNIENQEKTSIGIETAMVYIALLVGIVIWISILYFIKVIFFLELNSANNRTLYKNRFYTFLNTFVGYEALSSRYGVGVKAQVKETA